MTHNDCTIAQLSWAAARESASRIRTQVFIHEQHVSATEEWDGLDEQAIHFLSCIASGEAIATARIVREFATGKEHYHIGRVAVMRDYRGEGIGHRLMEYLIAWCKTHNAAAPIYLHAQTNRRKFYERLGFCAQGKEFMDAGIPHIYMIYSRESVYEYPFQS